MTARFPAIVKWLLTAAFFGWAMVLVIVICGEEAPDAPWSTIEFFMLKIMGVGSAYATYKAAKWCYDRGLFPKCIYTYMELCDKELDEEDDEL